MSLDSSQYSYHCIDNCGARVEYSCSRCDKCYSIIHNTPDNVERTINPETIKEEEITWKISLKDMEVGEITTTPDMLEEIVRKHLVTMHHYNQNITVKREA